MNGLVVQTRRVYVVLARILRLFFILGTAHYLVGGDFAAAALFALMYLICDTQVRLTRLEQKADGEL